MERLAPRLFDVPVAGFHEVPIGEANDLVVSFAHNLGPCRRPFRQQGWTLEVAGRPVAVAISASTVSDTVVDELGREWRRTELVECARLAGERWATRIMLRMWREVFARAWPDWPVGAAISYSQNARHGGELYRFDGWTRVRTDAGTSRGGGAWSRPRYSSDAALGPKSLWIWRYG